MTWVAFWSDLEAICWWCAIRPCSFQVEAGLGHIADDEEFHEGNEFGNCCTIMSHVVALCRCSGFSQPLKTISNRCDVAVVTVSATRWPDSSSKRPSNRTSPARHGSF